jgi:superfamily II DNA or RNA helicase
MLFEKPADHQMKLSAQDLAVAEVKAVVGQGLTKAELLSVVRAARAPTADGLSWSGPKLGESLALLTRKQVLDAQGVVSAEWRERLVLSLLARNDSAAILHAMRRAAPQSWRETGYRYWSSDPPASDLHLARSVRLMALAGDEAEVERLLGLAEMTVYRHESHPRGPALASLFLAGCPADAGFIQGLGPTLRDRVALAHLDLLLTWGRCDASVQRLVEWLTGRDEVASPKLEEALLRLDLLAERPERARARLERVRAHNPALAAAAEAALTFLTAPEISSLPQFRDALKLRRKAVGQRKVTLPNEFGLLHLMALFAADDGSLEGEIEALLDTAQMDESSAPVVLHALLDLVAGREERAMSRLRFIVDRRMFDRETEGPLTSAINTLALATVDPGLLHHREPGDRRAVEQWGAVAPLAARILAQTHAHFAKGGGRWQDIFDRLGPGSERRFLEIVPARAAWERALGKLEAALAPPQSPAKPEAPAQARRLIFRFDSATLEITPIEQSSKKGGWNPGRGVSLKRLHERDPKLDYLTEEDQRVLGAIKVDRNRYDAYYHFDPVKGPLALVGHPRVFDADHPERQVELLAYPAELVVREEGDQIRIDLSHRGHASSVFVEPETPTRWRVIHLTGDLVELGEVLGPSGLKVPKAARERVVAMVTREDSPLPVRSELAGVAPAAQGDCRPVLQIAPEGDGFQVHAVVRPLGPSGPAFAPGVGASSVLARLGGAQTRINRDLPSEVAALEAVIEACPALASWREGDHDWRIEAQDTALEALQQLHAFEGPLSLEWPQGAAIKPTRNVEAKALSLSVSSARDWFEVAGQIQVDDDLVVDMADLLDRLGSARGRFVPLDDGRFLALTDELRRRLEGFSAVTESVKGARRIGAAAAPAVEDLLASAGAVKTDRRWAALIDQIASAQRFEPELPIGLQAELRDYQLQGFTWLARLSRLGLGACLADDMGLGKTVQTLALLLAEAAKGPSLVISPTSVCHNWVLEAQRFAPDLRTHQLSAVSDRPALVERLGPGDVLVASYGLLHTESDLLASRRFAVAVFDEAQNLKNAETRRAKASKLIQADFRLALTGTPVENRLEELWSLFDTVSSGLLGSAESFHRRFAAPIQKGDGAQARQALKALVRPYLLRRTKAQVLEELPPRTEMVLEVELGPDERAFYEALRRRAVESLEVADGAPGQKRIRILAEITRLRRAACNPALVDPAAGVQSAKLAAFLELVAELRANRHRALVFSQFTGHLDLAEAALREAGVSFLRLDGSTPAKARAERVTAFQSGEGELFLISLKAGGAGLNLTGADYVIHLDPWWNPAVEDQATDRAHRIGQTRPVTVYRLVASDSIEEKILALHAAKRALAADFLDGAEAAGALDEDELMALIRG